jgi:hypothetical protein
MQFARDRRLRDVKATEKSSMTCPCLLLLSLPSADDIMQGVEALRCVIRCLETIVSLPLVLDALVLADLNVVSIVHLWGALGVCSVCQAHLFLESPSLMCIKPTSVPILHTTACQREGVPLVARLVSTNQTYCAMFCFQ